MKQEATLENRAPLASTEEVKRLPILFQLLGFFFKSKAGKVGSGAVGAGGLVALVLSLHSDVVEKIQAAELQAVKYVDAKHELVTKDIAYIRESQAEIKEMLKVIDKRLYDQRPKQ